MLQTAKPLFLLLDLYLPLDLEWEIDRDLITIKEQLGEGAFGLVMKGEAYGLLEMGVTSTVAVKMLKGIQITF